MSVRQIEKNVGKKKYVLDTHQASHAKGCLSGGQFNMYVANRLVIPGLEPRHLARFADGRLTLELLTRQFIHQHFQYQYLIVDHSKEAFTLEKKCQDGKIFGKKPLLNPL